jgi:hypothetical protein
LHLWATSKLANEIAVGQVSARDKMHYYVFSAVFLVAIGYAVDWSPADRSLFHLYEAVVVCIVTFAGALRVVSSYAKPIDGAFFEMSYLLSIPLVIKTTGAAWVAIYAADWLWSMLLPHISAESAESARAISYWLHRVRQAYPFLIAVAVTMVFWFRLAHHVAYVVAKRDA